MRTTIPTPAQKPRKPSAWVEPDEDVHLVTPLNRFYWLMSKWQRALDELAVGDMGKDRMMRESQLYAKAPKWTTFNRQESYAWVRKLGREAMREVVKPTPPTT